MKKKSIVTKNSLWARTILRQKFGCLGFDGSWKVSADLDNKEYLLVQPVDESLEEDMQFRLFDSCDAEFFHRYLENNPYVDYVVYVTDFIEKVTELYKN